MTDLIASVVRDYGWPQLRVYANSLARSGFEGTKLMFVDDITAEARDNLTELGFVLVDTMLPPPPSCVPAVFMLKRHKPLLEWLERNHEQLRYVICTGTRDVLFQADPTVWLANNLQVPCIVGAGEGWRIKNESINDGWLRAMFDSTQCDALGEHEVLCADTISGTSTLMLELLRYMDRLLQGASLLAMDQGVLNFILRTQPFDALTRVPALRDGYVATWWPEKMKTDGARLIEHDAPLFDISDGTVYTPDGKTPYSMVHQYDRSPAWRDLMEAKYA
jgi:hypothetical protein